MYPAGIMEFFKGKCAESLWTREKIEKGVYAMRGVLLPVEVRSKRDFVRFVEVWNIRSFLRNRTPIEVVKAKAMRRKGR